MAFDTCRLCLKKKLLHKKSHIIPDFMYEGLFDGNHKMALADLINDNKKPQMAQSGIWQKFILCVDCERKNFGELDRYGSSVIFENEIRHSPIKKEYITILDDLRGLKVSGINEVKFKKFILSILFRAHISNHKFFAGVNLSETDTNKLRDLLLQKDDALATDYQIAVLGVFTPSKQPAKILIPPHTNNTTEGSFAIFYITGYIYIINIGANKFLDIYQPLALSENGELIIPFLTGARARTLLQAFNLPKYVLDYFTP